MGNGWPQLTALAIFMYLTWKYKGMHQFDTLQLVLHTHFLVSYSIYKGHYYFFSHLCRQHWFISRMNGGAVTSGGFCPKNNALVITTSKNEVYVFDVEAKQLGEWSKRYTHHLPRSFQEFPGEVIGLSFPPQSSSIVVVYSTR